MARELTPGETLCKEGDVSTEIFILQQGTLDVLIRDKKGREKKISEISEKNSIIGEIGAILKQPRSATLRASTTVLVNSIDVKKKALDETILAQPRLGLSISLNLAKYLKDTNARLKRYTEFLSTVRKVVDGYLLYYYQKSKSVGDLFDTMRFSWAKSIYDKTKSHICYGMGEGVSRGQEVVAAAAAAAPPAPAGESPQLSGARDFAAGETLCREGEEGREIFILQGGTLEVQVGGRKVAEIKDRGAVIGEVAVLAGYASRAFEKRTATLLVREAASVIVIDGSKLEAVISANPQLILFITKVLSERLPVTNGALMAADEQIKKYLALVDSVGVTTMTVINALELLRSNLQQQGKDKLQLEGYEQEVDEKLAAAKDAARDLFDGYAGLA